ncbi:hypothetical protein HDV00_004903 [Rhizophlyctis rosea]|nr:hypothetical protein HDV00_004903 [Rhizophlyctis rosea]
MAAIPLSPPPDGKDGLKPPTSTWATEDGNPPRSLSRNQPLNASQLSPINITTTSTQNSKSAPVETEKNDTLAETTTVDVEDEYDQFTWRSSIIGSLLGCLVAASNFYLGLKVGWTFGAQLFAAICTFGILKPLTNSLGGYFGPKENATAQTAGSTAGGLSVGFITGIPAMYRLGLLSDDVTNDILKLAMWTISAAFYGLFFAVPLRKHFVIKRDLPFPTPTATAETIRTLHGTAEKEKEAVQRVRAMGITFAMSFLTIFGSYWVYFLDKIHILYWIGHATNHIGLQTADIVWGWYFTPNFAFLGAGLITPAATLISFLVGSVIAFGIGGPLMVDSGYLSSPLGWGKKGNGSAQAWWFWPGIALMVVTAAAELLVHWRSLGGAMTDLFVSMIDSTKVVIRRWQNGEKEAGQKMVAKKDDDDPAPLSDQVPRIWWVGGLCVSVVFTSFVMSHFYTIPLYQTLLSLILAFLLSLVGIQSTAETDINPISTLAKVVQLLFAKFPAPSLPDLQRNNILSAALTAATSQQAADMVCDLKTANDLRASPKAMFKAQIVGSVFAIPIAVTLFVVFAKAYPCILDETVEGCEFGLSPVLGWQNFTLLLTTNAVIPTASVVTAGCCALLAVVYTILKHRYVPKEYHDKLPNLNAIGLGFVVPQPSTPFAMCVALLGGLVWHKVGRDGHDEYRLSVASGAIAGVGIAAVVRAVMRLSGVEDRTVSWNCPLNAKGGLGCL